MPRLGLFFSFPCTRAAEVTSLRSASFLQSGPESWGGRTGPSGWVPNELAGSSSASARAAEVPVCSEATPGNHPSQQSSAELPHASPVPTKHHQKRGAKGEPQTNAAWPSPGALGRSECTNISKSLPTNSQQQLGNARRVWEQPRDPHNTNWGNCCPRPTAHSTRLPWNNAPGSRNTILFT